MFKNILNKKFYLLIVTIIMINGCGGTSSGSNNYATTPQPYTDSLDTLSNQELYAYSKVPEFSPYSQTIISENNLSSIESQEAISNIQQKLLDAINEQRAKEVTCGDRGTFGPVHPLTWNSHLHASALEHITDLALSRTFSHDGSGTEYDITGNGHPSKFYERIVANGYTNYYSVGENIAGGQRTITEVMDAWMASPGHCENIMKSTYTEVGFTVIKVDGSPYLYYWGQNFGSKRR